MTFDDATKPDALAKLRDFSEALRRGDAPAALAAARDAWTAQGVPEQCKGNVSARIFQ